MNGGDLAERLQAVVTGKIGKPGTIHALEQLTGGANRSTLALEAEIGAARLPLIVQLGVETPDPVAGMTPEVAPAEQARLMITAVAAGVPAPRVRATLGPADGLGEGYITERVAGETLGPRIIRDERFARARPLMARQCGEILAAIHRIDVDRVPFLESQDAAEHVAAFRRLPERYGFRLPALELALRWATENLPKKTRHTVVHGDFRMGNLIVDEEGVRCVLDWELAHTGDPMEDLGWLCIRTWRFWGGRPGRRLRHARRSFRGLRAGQRLSGGSGPRPFLGGLRQRQVGAALPAPGVARDRQPGYRTMRDRTANRRTAMGLL
jgi:hypothetical protein